MSRINMETFKHKVKIGVYDKKGKLINYSWITTPNSKAEEQKSLDRMYKNGELKHRMKVLVHKERSEREIKHTKKKPVRRNPFAIKVPKMRLPKFRF